ncbi:MAG: ParB/RepB/Spo0J family partition protein, partial [Ectothiorhodospiraceae bacterium AqS1]|nr:ParB/RepB/Spo0J family partition protein [Ectothiorhodospiraceae bacterium AqS1]
IAGERRWRAAQAAELHTVPAIVRDCPDEEAAAIALIENIQREDLNPIEEAEGFRTLAGEFGLTHGQLAEAVGRSRPSISNALRLLDLNPDVRTLVQKGDLQMGHARALLGIKGKAQSATAKEVVRRGLSTGETERLVRAKAPEKRTAADADSSTTRRDADLERLETDLGERLGTRVRIDHKKSGTGRLVIHYAGLDALDGILERIR